MASSINMFVNFPEAAMNEYVIVMITIITVVNILAGKVVMGGGPVYLLFLREYPPLYYWSDIYRGTHRRRDVLLHPGLYAGVR